ncbi:MAG TPA: MarR family transcriptional regulator [Polyangiaceae bacterium]|nr:MarR family transcriptional regulator [Polyangiaceae bacterium]
MTQAPTKPSSGRAPSQRTALGDAFSLLVVRIFQTNGYLLAAGDSLAAPAGQSSARWQVMAAIEESARSVADIARLLGLARQSVQRVADLLVEDGLAVYRDNPAHQRAKLLELTPHGREQLARIAEAQAVWANDLAERLGERHIANATAALTALLGLLAPEVASEDS